MTPEARLAVDWTKVLPDIRDGVVDASAHSSEGYQRAIVRSARLQSDGALSQGTDTSRREADIRRAIQTGIHGYLLLGESIDELVDSVRAVGNGSRYLSPIVAQRMADSLAGETLTQRENEVLRLVATGQSSTAGP